MCQEKGKDMGRKWSIAGCLLIVLKFKYKRFVRCLLVNDLFKHDKSFLGIDK